MENDYISVYEYEKNVNPTVKDNLFMKKILTK